MESRRVVRNGQEIKVITLTQEELEQLEADHKNDYLHATVLHIDAELDEAEIEWTDPAWDSLVAPDGDWPYAEFEPDPEFWPN